MSQGTEGETPTPPHEVDFDDARSALEARQKSTLEYVSAIRKHLQVVRSLSFHNDEAASMARLSFGSNYHRGKTGDIASKNRTTSLTQNNKVSLSSLPKAGDGGLSRFDDGQDFCYGDEGRLRREAGYFRVRLLSQEYSVWSPSMYTLQSNKLLTGPAISGADPLPSFGNNKPTSTTSSLSSAADFRRRSSSMACGGATRPSAMMGKINFARRGTTCTGGDDDVFAADGGADLDKERRLSSSSSASSLLSLGSSACSGFIIAARCSPEFRKAMDEEEKQTD